MTFQVNGAEGSIEDLQEAGGSHLDVDRCGSYKFRLPDKSSLSRRKSRSKVAERTERRAEGDN